MRIAITIVILLIAGSSYGQRKSQTSNQREGGSWADNNARKFFKENYKRQNHQPFSGKISTLAKGTYKYNSDIIITNDTAEANQCLFEKGLLHSGLFGGGRDTIYAPIQNR